MHDADGPGDDGAKESLWRLHEHGLEAYLVWSSRRFGGNYAGRQPESITTEEWLEMEAARAVHSPSREVSIAANTPGNEML